jgi:hypothetical protein
MQAKFPKEFYDSGEEPSAIQKVNWIGDQP